MRAPFGIYTFSEMSMRCTIALDGRLASQVIRRQLPSSKVESNTLIRKYVMIASWKSLAAWHFQALPLLDMLVCGICKAFQRLSVCQSTLCTPFGERQGEAGGTPSSSKANTCFKERRGVHPTFHFVGHAQFRLGYAPRLFKCDLPVILLQRNDSYHLNRFYFNACPR